MYIYIYTYIYLLVYLFRGLRPESGNAGSSFIHAFLNSFIQSFVHSFNQSIHQSTIQSINHSIIRSFNHSFIHSFIGRGGREGRAHARGRAPAPTSRLADASQMGPSRAEWRGGTWDPSAPAVRQFGEKWACPANADARGGWSPSLFDVQAWSMYVNSCLAGAKRAQ